MTTPPYLKKILFILLLLFSLTSCKEEGEVKLELKNKEVYFASTCNGSGYRYRSDTLRQKAQNIIAYTFTNTTDKKLLFVFDKEALYPAVKIESNEKGYAGFLISNNIKIKPFSMPLVTFSKTNSPDFINYILYRDSVRENKYKEMGINSQNFETVDNYLNNSFVVAPNESKTFKTILRLPIIREIRAETGTPPLYFTDLKEGDEFKLFYSCNANSLKKILPQYIREELKKNEIEIFDGELTANIVKLRKR